MHIKKQTKKISTPSENSPWWESEAVGNKALSRQAGLTLLGSQASWLRRFAAASLEPSSRPPTFCSTWGWYWTQVPTLRFSVSTHVTSFHPRGNLEVDAPPIFTSHGGPVMARPTPGDAPRAAPRIPRPARAPACSPPASGSAASSPARRALLSRTLGLLPRPWPAPSACLPRCPLAEATWGSRLHPRAPSGNWAPSPSARAKPHPPWAPRSAWTPPPQNLKTGQNPTVCLELLIYWII